MAVLMGEGVVWVALAKSLELFNVGELHDLPHRLQNNSEI